MEYFSLNKKSPVADFKQATIQGQAPDKGLYFPASIPLVDKEIIANIKSISKDEIAFRVMQPYVGGTIDDMSLQRIVSETVDFVFPLEKIREDIYSLELYHGPTLAFKDVGARFMSRCLGYFSKDRDKKITVLVATSGDTGGAVANGFLGVEGIEVVILYPSGKVSPVQELQLTTCGQNIQALEVNGSFDDCQAMVKDAFMDLDINKKLSLTSANSINVARWLPQQLYYFFAMQQWQQQDAPVISVPSGNFGNLCAGLLACKSGLPVKHFIAACNVNDTVPQYLVTGNYRPKTAVPTISNAMDVGNPSNFVRILELFQDRHNDIARLISGFTVSDERTRETIAETYKRFNYVLDPHGSVAYEALQQYVHEHPGDKGFILETAHPVKFPEVVEEAIGRKIEMPASAKHLPGKKKESILIDPSFEDLKEWLMNIE